MKNILLITTYIMIAALTFGIVMTLHGRETRSMELQGSLSSVVEETVENMMLAKNYEISDTNLFLADLAESLSDLSEAESDLTVKVLKAEKEKGILTVEVEESYKHLNGNTGSVKCTKTVLFNRLTEEPENSYIVRFYLTEDDLREQKNCYKAVTVFGGDSVTAPAEPILEGAVFEGWRDENGYLADFTQPVTGEIAYYAGWNG